MSQMLLNAKMATAQGFAIKKTEDLFQHCSQKFIFEAKFSRKVSLNYFVCNGVCRVSWNVQNLGKQILLMELIFRNVQCECL